MAAVGFSPRKTAQKADGVAERRLKRNRQRIVACQASLRDAQPFLIAVPWAEAYGYRQAIATR